MGSYDQASAPPPEGPEPTWGSPESNRGLLSSKPSGGPAIPRMVGAAGFEPANLPVQSRTFYQLNYTPVVVDALGIDPSPPGISDLAAHLRTTSMR